MKRFKVIALTFCAVFAADVLFGAVSIFMYNNSLDDYESDWESLRRITAEAYINVREDPDFVNTATEDQPMEIPNSYYTSTESALGYGKIGAVVYEDGRVKAYLGTSEKTLDYLRSEEFTIRKPSFPFIFNAVLDCFSCDN